MQVSAPLGMTTPVHARHQARRGHARRGSGCSASCPREWSALVDALRAASAPYRSALLDGRTEYLLWQTLAGTWTDDGPIAEDRLVEYLTKAIREAKSRTTWTAPDEPYEGAVLDAARQALLDPEVVAELFSGWELRTRAAVRAATLGTKLVQLDPARHRRRLPGHRGAGPGPRRPRQPPAGRRWSRWSPAWPGSTTAPARATSPTRSCWSPRERCALRRSLPEAFVGPDSGFLPLAHSSGPLADLRPDRRRPTPRVAVVATRLAAAVDRLGGWADHTVALPDGDWHDVLTDRPVRAGSSTSDRCWTGCPSPCSCRAEG